MRQARLDDWIFQGLLDVEHLPAELSRLRPRMTTRRRRRRRPRRADRGRPAGRRAARAVMRRRQGRRGDRISAPGTIDVLGYAPDRVERPGEALARPRRPPSTRTRASAAPSASRGALDWFKRQFDGGPLGATATAATSARTSLLPTAVGAARSRARSSPRRWPPATCATTRRCSSSASTRCSDFHPALLADNVARGGVPGAVGRDRGARRRPPGGQRPRARAGDGRTPTPRAEIVRQVERGLDGAARVGFPAGLGAERSARRVERPAGAARRARRSRSRRCRPPSPACGSSETLRARLRERGGRIVLNSEAVLAVRDGRASRRCRATAARARRSTAAPRWSCSPPAAWRAAASSSTRTGARARPRSACRCTACPAPGEPALRARLLRRAAASRAAGVAVDDAHAPRRRRGRAPPGQRARGRRDAGRRRALEARSRATASAWRAGTARPSSITARSEPMSRRHCSRAMRDSLDHCVKCTICETACPFATVTPLFPGPKYVGPQAERFRTPTSRCRTRRSTTAPAAASAPRCARRASTSRRSTRRRRRAMREREASRCATA